MSNIQTGAERMPHDLSHLGFLAGQIGRLITISTTPVIADRKSGSAGMPRPISYAVFCLKKKTIAPLDSGIPIREGWIGQCGRPSRRGHQRTVSVLEVERSV